MLRPLKPIVDPAVEAAFEAFPADLRSGLLQLREMIIETAEKTEHVGPLLETTKWGQPAYLPSRPRVGSTVRIGTLKKAAGEHQPLGVGQEMVAQQMELQLISKRLSLSRQ